jgi:hypothetical protein
MNKITPKRAITILNRVAAGEQPLSRHDAASIRNALSELAYTAKVQATRLHALDVAIGRAQ